MPRQTSLKTVYLVDGVRTPFLITPAKSPHYTALDLSVISARALLVRHAFNAQDIDAFVMSCSHANTSELAFELKQRLIIQPSKDNCQATTLSFTGELSGFEVLEYACQQIALNQKQLVLVGGVDTLSENTPTNTHRFKTAYGLESLSQKLLEKSPRLGNLTARYIGCEPAFDQHQTLRQFAEKKAVTLNLPPQAIADYIQLSQRRVQFAQRNHLLASVIPVFYPDGQVSYRDQGISYNDTSSQHAINEVTGYKPVLPHNAIAPPAEGAGFLLLASEASVKHYQLPVIARLSFPVWTCTDSHNGENIAVNQATKQLLGHTQLTVNDIDYWEINEHTAVDILAAQQQNDQNEAISSLSHVNIDGGTLTLGNPPTANSMRMVLQLAHILKRENAAQGIATSTFADGREFALLVQNIKNIAQEEKT